MAASMAGAWRLAFDVFEVDVFEVDVFDGARFVAGCFFGGIDLCLL